MIHRIQILEVVALEFAVDAPTEEEAYAAYARGKFTQRHRTVIDRTESIGYPPMSWDEFVATSKAEVKRSAIIVAAWDEAEAKRAAARKAGTA